MATRVAFTIKPNTWVNLVLAGFMAWLVIITVVIWTAAELSSTKPKTEPPCRTIHGHDRPQSYCDNGYNTGE